MALAIGISAAQGELPTGRGYLHPGRPAFEGLPIGAPTPLGYDIEGESRWPHQNYIKQI